MRWYSASAWEHHTCRHTQDNLPIHPDDPGFYEQFSATETLPSTSKLATILPQTNNIQERAKAAKQFIEEGDKKSPSPGARTHSPTTPKRCIKQGPIKSSKKVKAVEHKDDDD